MGGRQQTPRASRPTVKDVAALAGVSAAAVSYVLSGRPGRVRPVGEETRKRVLAAAAALNYVPNQAAGSLRRGQTKLICLLRASLGDRWGDLLAADLQRAAEARGYALIIILADSVDVCRRALALLQGGLADAAVMGTRHVGVSDLRSLVARGLPLVVFSERLEPDGFDVVRYGEARACYDGVRHLIDQGHRRVAFLGRSFDTGPTPSDRFAAYVRALSDASVPLDRELIAFGADDRVAAYHSTKRLLGLADPPTAIFSATDRGAISAITALRDCGLRIPQEVAVMGVGNLPEGEITSPPLTTIGPERLDFSVVANRIFERLESGVLDSGRVLELAWKLILRGSA